MDDIIEPTMDYDFSKLYFGPPSSLAGGAYFTRIMYSTNKPLFIQTPKSLTKQGFVKSGKKIYVDLMFDNNDTVFINWIENLEAKCQDLIYAKRDAWFESKLEKDDIEGAFTSPFKIFKSGKYYLLRVNVKQNIKIYDEANQVVPIENIGNDKTIISILEIQGLKFTSRNFQIEIELKQSMIVNPDPFLDECFIKKPVKRVPVKEEQIDLDELINQSVKDLQSTKTDTKPVEKYIDLETSFTEEKEMANMDVKDNSTSKMDANILGLEEAEITFPEEVIEEVIEEDPAELKEVDLSSALDNSLEAIQLKKPNQVYYEIYQKAREKAKEAKKNAVLAYLEMKNIKKTYMLDDIDESDSEFEEFEGENDSDNDSDAESLEDEYK